MSRYVDLFLADGGQVVVLSAVLLLWAGLTVLGGWIAGSRRLAEGDVMYGWAAVATVYTVAGVLLDLPFIAVTWGFFILTPALAWWRWRRDGHIFSAAMVRMALLGAPLLLIASAMMVSQWDEFSHWVPSARFLFLNDGFPDAGNPFTGASFPAYPYNWPLLSYLAGRLAGGFLENAGGVLNILLLLSFALAVRRLVLIALDGEETASWDWGLCALAALAVFMSPPGIVQKVTLTAYADAGTAVAVGFGGVLGWLMIGALATGDQKGARRLAWQFGLVMLVLVNLKQSTFVLFVLLTVAVLLAGLRDPEVSARRLLGSLPAMILPPLIIYILWRYHVASELTGREFSVRPLAEWHLHLIPDILARMLLVASKKGAYFAVMALASGFAIKGLVRFGGGLDRLAIIVGAVFLGHNAFLFFSYVAVFGEHDALIAGSFWRYNLHVGLLAVAFGTFGAARLWKIHLAWRVNAAALAWLPVVLALAAPLVLAPKLRFDLDPPVPYYRAVARAVAEIMPPDARLLVLDPRGSGQAGVITRYDLGRRASEFVGIQAAFDDFSPAAVSRMLGTDMGASHLLVHSLVPTLREGLGMDLPAAASHLLERDGEKGWRTLHSWPRPGDPE